MTITLNLNLFELEVLIYSTLPPSIYLGWLFHRAYMKSLKNKGKLEDYLKRMIK